jgi:hypothetical protein
MKEPADITVRFVTWRTCLEFRCTAKGAPFQSCYTVYAELVFDIRGLIGSEFDVNPYPRILNATWIENVIIY